MTKLMKLSVIALLTGTLALVGCGDDETSGTGGTGATGGSGATGGTGATGGGGSVDRQVGLFAGRSTQQTDVLAGRHQHAGL